MSTLNALVRRFGKIEFEAVGLGVNCTIDDTVGARGKTAEQALKAASAMFLANVDSAPSKLKTRKTSKRASKARQAYSNARRIALKVKKKRTSRRR